MSAEWRTIQHYGDLDGHWHALTWENRRSIKINTSRVVRAYSAAPST